MTNGELRLITVAVADAEVVEAVDRGGGEAHGLIRRGLAAVPKMVPFDQFAAQLDEVMGQVRAVTNRLAEGINEFEADELTIALAVSSEGSVGVATAGVEATIQVMLKRKVKAQ